MVKRSSKNRWLNRNRDKHFCNCGCGEYIDVKLVHHKRGIPKFIKGHNFSSGFNPKTDEECEVSKHSSSWDLLTDEEKERRLSNLKKFKTGDQHPGWKNGRIQDEYGYIKVRVPEHTFAVGGYVLEHRLVMEEYLREKYPGSPYLHWHEGELYLRPEVVVHHEDECKSRNTIDNLFPFPDNAAHIFWHKSKLSKKEKIEKIKRGEYRTYSKEKPNKDE